MDQPRLNLVGSRLQGPKEAWNNLLDDSFPEVCHVCIESMGFLLVIEQELQPSSESLFPRIAHWKELREPTALNILIDVSIHSLEYEVFSPTQLPLDRPKALADDLFPNVQ